MELVGAQLAAVHKQKGYTQEQLAQKLNVSRTNIYRWESGKIIPDLETVRLLSQILEYDFFTAKEPTSDSIFPLPIPRLSRTHPGPGSANGFSPELERFCWGWRCWRFFC